MFVTNTSRKLERMVRNVFFFITIILKFVFNLNDEELNNYSTLKPNKEGPLHDLCNIFTYFQHQIKRK